MMIVTYIFVYGEITNLGNTRIQGQIFAVILV